MFCYRSSLGLHQSVLRRADEKLSFSDMTVPTSVDESRSYLEQDLPLLPNHK